MNIKMAKIMGTLNDPNVNEVEAIWTNDDKAMRAPGRGDHQSNVARAGCVKSRYLTVYCDLTRWYMTHILYALPEQHHLRLRIFNNDRCSVLLMSRAAVPRMLTVRCFRAETYHYLVIIPGWPKAVCVANNRGRM